VLHAVIIALCVAFGAGIAYSRGQDIDFDQLNYHFYSVYAFVAHRIGQDVAPAQVMHSYFSPIVYLPFYAMVQWLPPRMVGLGLGALHGLNLWLVFIIARMVTPAIPRASRIAVIIVAVVVSGASPMAMSELGTSMADLLISLPILAGIALLMQAEFRAGRAVWTIATIGLAGAFVGAAVSLKLTGASFALGLAAAALVGWTSWRPRIIALLATGLGGAIGFAACGGYWYLLMWRTFRNPVFPYYNTIFRSPDYQTAYPLFDAHYIPHSILEALRLPFFWVRTQTSTTEAPFRDIRFTLLIILGIAALAVRGALRRRASAPTLRPQPSGLRLITFMVVAFAFWMYEWSIQRYLVPLELLMGPAIVVVLQWTGFFDVVRGRALMAAGALGALVCVATVRSPDWGHIGWRQSWYEVHPPETSGEHPVYFLVQGPLSFTVPSLKPGATAVGVVNWEDMPGWGDTVFMRRIQELVTDPRNGPFWAVTADPIPDSFISRMQVYGLKLEGECQKTKGRPWPLTWCTLVRTTPAG
jgi:hypothetical protein